MNMNDSLFWKSGTMVVAAILIITFFNAMWSPLSGDQPAVALDIGDIGEEHQTSTLEYSFTFEEPRLKPKTVSEQRFTQVEMPGTISIGQQTGTPSYQVKPVKMLLPQGTKVKGITTRAEETVELDTASLGIDLLESEPIIPYQPQVPIGAPAAEFVFDEEIYQSVSLFPEKKYSSSGVGVCRGYSILTVDLYPTSYNPGEGKFWYHPQMTISIDLEETGDVDRFYRSGHHGDRIWVQSLVSNPEVADTYGGYLAQMGYSGGLCDPSDNEGRGYDYVIIVREGLYDWIGTTYNWDDFIIRKEIEGIETIRVTVEDIIACPDYWNPSPPTPEFNDTAYLIREFCRDAYQDWGLEYVLVAGDQDGVHEIDRRLMDYDYEGNCESDLYWSNLHNTFNEDHDNDWGEYGDPGFDRFSELYIGSIPCDTGDDISNWLTKSFYYADSLDQNYLDNAGFYGGSTGWSCQGDDFIDYSAVKGTSDWLGPIPGEHGPYPSWLGFQYGFETWNKENLGLEYNLSTKWTAEPPNPGWMGGSESAAINGLRNSINNDEVTLLSGIAHANEHMSLDVGATDWEALYHNTRPFFIHDYGCHCGDMDAADDGILHSMLFHSDTELAFACVYHTGYGWGSFYDTNSSSALQQKSFWDYLFDVVNHSGSPLNWQLGRAHAWSKDYMAPTINWTCSGAPGSWRGVIEMCLLFGDPAQLIKPPLIPEHNVGITSLDVPRYVLPGEEVPVQTTIVNNGKHDEYNVYVSFRVDDVEQANTTIPVIENRTTDQVSFPWIPPSVGFYTITINISIPGVIEDYYFDNERSKEVIAGPDVAVTHLVAPPYAAIDRLTPIDGTIANLGASNEWITVYLETNGTIEDSTVIYLESGETTVVTFDWIPSIVGTYPIAMSAEIPGDEPFLDNNEMNQSISVFLTEGYVLLVDDDEGESYETYFEEGLWTSGYLFDRWVRDSEGSPSPDLMLTYDAVIWFTGDDEDDTLDATDQVNLVTYLTNGGSLFITGEDIGVDIGATSFYQDYLSAEYLVDDTNSDTLLGVPGDPITDGLIIGITGGDGADNQDTPSGIAPLGTATTILTYQDAAYDGAISNGYGSYRVVYFAFGFEAINTAADRTEVMDRVLAWLVYEHNLGVRTVDVSPSHATFNRTVYINATVFNNGRNDETNVTISLRINDTEVDSVTIPVVERWTIHQINFTWTTPTEAGKYQVTINISAPGVPEDLYLDNEKSTLLRVGILNVDTDTLYNTIQQACDAAETIDGHVLLAPAGSYYENILITKNLTLMGMNKDSTSIYAANPDISTIRVQDTSSMNLTQLTIRNGAQGVLLNGTSSTNISMIRVQENTGAGIQLIGSCDTLITENILWNNGYGIALSDVSTNNTITENTIGENLEGISIPAGCIDNLIYRNNFINNTQQAHDYGSNTWYQIYPIAGNYWSDFDEPSEGVYDLFRGADQTIPENDSICDQGLPDGGLHPYLIPGGSSDQYPFITADGWDHPPWWGCWWITRKEFTIDHTKIQEDLFDFPLLIYRNTDDELAHHAQPDGDDIIFVDMFNTMKYDHEIEYYNSTTGELAAWVRIPVLSATEDTCFYMYFGNPACESYENAAGVWDANYVMVQHLSETTGPHTDSTGNDNHGIAYNGVIQNAQGKIDGADDFDGEDDYIEISYDDSLDIRDAITLEAWVNSSLMDTYRALINARKTDYGPYLLQASDAGYQIGVYLEGNWRYVGKNRYAAGNWYYVVGTYDKDGGYDNLKCYVNGESNQVTYTGRIDASRESRTIAHNYGHSDRWFGGKLDEVRISNIARSPAWINASYENTRNPEEFINVSYLSVDADGPYVDCIGQPVTFNGSASGGIPPYNWSWDFGDGNHSWEQNPTHTYAIPGDYVAMVTVVDGVGMSITDTASVTIFALDSLVYVDDDFDETTPGWGIDHFDTIQAGVDASNVSGGIYIYYGMYPELVTINKQLYIKGQATEEVIIDGDNGGTVVTITSPGVTINSVTIQHSGYDPSSAGIKVTADDTIITNCIIADNLFGIHLLSADNTLIEDTILKKNGLVVYNSFLNTVVNTLVNNKPLVYLEEVEDFDIETEIGYAGQIILINCDNITIHNQEIANVTVGIELFNTHNCFITNNAVMANRLSGIHLLTSTNNLISENLIEDNYYGIKLYANSDTNLIYHNNFINNNEQANDSCANQWNLSYPSGGNYWSDFDEPSEGAYDLYQGPDQNISGADEIVDSPYIIPGGDNLDHYPFVSYHGWSYGSWWDYRWQYRKKVTINHTLIPEEQPDFPVLIYRESDTNLALNAQHDGDDLMFIDYTNTIQYDHEIELYNETTGELVAWVHIPLLASESDTIVYMYYGNPSCGNQQNPIDVWDTHFAMVQHLNETSGMHDDSTSFGNDGAPYGGVMQDIEGKIAGADAFDGSNDYIEIAYDSSLDIRDAITMEAWVNGDEYDGYMCLINGRKSDFGPYLLQANDAGFEIGVMLDGSWKFRGNPGHTPGTWYYVVGTYDKDGGSNNLKIYVDTEVSQISESGRIDASEEAKTIGHNYGHGGRWFDGKLDEIRISNCARTAEWITTSFNNQNDPTAFITVGSQQISNNPPAPPVKPTGRIWGTEDQIYTYRTSTTDPEGDNVYYKWDWGDGHISDWLGSYISGDPATADHAWSQPGHYYIRVKAKDTNGLESDWSEAQHVVMRRFGMPPIPREPWIPD